MGYSDIIKLEQPMVSNISNWLVMAIIMNRRNMNSVVGMFLEWERK